MRRLRNRKHSAYGTPSAISALLPSISRRIDLQIGMTVAEMPLALTSREQGFLEYHRMGEPEHNEFQQGNVALVKGRFEDAIASFLKHASKYPHERADTFAKIAECYKRTNIAVPGSSVTDEFTLVSKGNTRMAEYYYRCALKENPAHAPSLKGITAILPEGSEERLKIIEKLFQVQPDYLLTLELVHWNFKKANNPEQAYKWYLEAQKLKPRDREVYDCLQAVCRCLGKTDETTQWKRQWQDIYKQKRRLI